MRITLGVVAATALLAAGGTSAAAPRTYECQHPTTTGEEAYNLHNVKPHRACVLVRKLAAFLAQDDNAGYAKLYHCKRPAPDQAGTPVLNLHKLFNWRVRIARSGAFEFYRGGSRFDVSGTDFPLNCT